MVKQAEFFLERSTPGTHLYKAIDEHNAVSRSVYINKDCFKGERTPDKIRLTVEAIDA